MQHCEPKRLLCGIFSVALLLSAPPADCRAQPFPGNNPVRIIIPTTPGAPPDVVGRIIATELATNENWRVVVENRPGALQTLAMAEVLKRPADGLTIFPMSLGAIATPALLPGKSPRLEADFAPIVKVATGYTVMVVHPSVPAQNLAELVAALKAQPDRYNYSSGGFSTPAHLLGEMFKLQTGTSFSLVQYGAQQRVADLIGGTTHFSFFNTPSVVDLVAAGKLRALALAAPRRVAAFKDVPTVAEAGFPSLVAEDWVGFVVKAGTPPDAIARLNAAVNKVLATQRVRDTLSTLGYEAAGGTPAALGGLIESQVGYWSKIVRDAGIKLPQ